MTSLLTEKCGIPKQRASARQREKERDSENVYYDDDNNNDSR